jgi:hypothetical protein
MSNQVVGYIYLNTAQMTTSVVVTGQWGLYGIWANILKYKHLRFAGSRGLLGHNFSRFVVTLGFLMVSVGILQVRYRPLLQRVAFKVERRLFLPAK